MAGDWWVILNSLGLFISYFFQTRDDKRRNIESLQSLPEYLDKSGIDRISREIEHLNFHAAKIRTIHGVANAHIGSDGHDNSVGGNKDNSFHDISATCPVCLTIPADQIFTCINCDNLICGTCRVKLTSCPTCRKTFKNNNAPRRNRLAEKLIASRKWIEV